jgi:hypothetical protein
MERNKNQVSGKTTGKTQKSIIKKHSENQYDKKDLYGSMVEDFHLLLMFDNTTQKKFDMKLYFQYAVFFCLKNRDLFQQIVNRGYSNERIWKLI